jgi:hypothetical protein
MPPPSSHPCFVSFAGVTLGRLTGFDNEFAGGSLQDATSGDSRVVGYGANARVVKQWDCTSIESGTLSLTFWGPPGFSPDDRGTRGVLTFSAPESTYSAEAILVRFSHSGRAGQYASGSAEFQFTGA